MIVLDGGSEFFHHVVKWVLDERSRESDMCRYLKRMEVNMVVHYLLSNRW